jgi:hypothetical protein
LNESRGSFGAAQSRFKDISSMDVTGASALFMPLRSGRNAGTTRVYRLTITLERIRPAIWRRFEVPGAITLAKLHRVLQRVMGWRDTHLHQFFVDGRGVGVRDPESVDQVEDEKKLTLAEVAPAVGTKLVYLYDFSDYWRHEVLVVAIDPPGETRHPICLAGERACPPEECGGWNGYEVFLTAIQDPRHEEYEEMLAWAGGPFDPEAFDVQAVNRSLKAMR